DDQLTAGNGLEPLVELRFKPALCRERARSLAFPMIVVDEENDLVRGCGERLGLDGLLIGGQDDVDLEPSRREGTAQLANEGNESIGCTVRYRFEVDDEAGKAALLHVAEQICLQGPSGPIGGKE